jgi:hypothetical protein
MGPVAVQARALTWPVTFPEICSPAMTRALPAMAVTVGWTLPKATT